MTINQMLTGSPRSWQDDLSKTEFTEIEQVINRMVTLRETDNLRNTHPTTKRLQYQPRKQPQNRQLPNKNQINWNIQCQKCLLHGHKSDDCRTTCRKCNSKGHSHRTCSSCSQTQTGIKLVTHNNKHDTTDLIVEAKLNNQPVQATIDSGAQRSLLSQRFTKQLNLKINPTEQKLVGLNKDYNIDTSGQVDFLL
ncbi:Uncharacterised protein r2_g1151 [Pycnogonum litorale]